MQDEGIGSAEELLLLDRNQNVVTLIPSGGYSPDSPIDKKLTEKLTAAVRASYSGESSPVRVRSLDLAETISQSLLNDADNVCFSVCANPMQLSSLTEAGTPQLRRPVYYGIITMEDSEKSMAYSIKPAEQYKKQLQEDEQLEKLWSQMLGRLPKD